MILPDYLKSGEIARLFPVLATTSKEGRTTSIVLACLAKVDEFGTGMLAGLGQRAGKTSSLVTYTEVVFRSQTNLRGDRPDGLIVLRTGKREWRALVEAKVGNALIEAEQVERYRLLAKENDLDAVITISNQFTANAQSHPLEEVRRARSKIPVYHWSWMSLLTQADLLLSNDGVADADQSILLNELRRFLSHESAGVRGFERMPPDWTELNRLVSAGGKIPARAPELCATVDAWHQETRDLSLILSRKTETQVVERLPRKHRSDPTVRQKDDMAQLRDAYCLSAQFEIPDAAAPIEVTADLQRRSVDVGMRLKAPDDRVSSKARVNWLLRQIKTEAREDIFVRLCWPGKSEDTQFPLVQLDEDVSVVDTDKSHLTVSSFYVFMSRRFGARFTQQVNFVTDLEMLVPEFYTKVGQGLRAWKKSPPKIKASGADVASIETEAQGYTPPDSAG